MLPLVITVERVDGGTRRYAFADSPVSIGRSPFAELQLSEPFISRWEGTLRFDAEEITYFSLGSTNITYLNGKSLAPCDDDIPLRVDSLLTLGDLKLRFSREPVAECDLRRRGKRRPTRDDTETGMKTVYLDAADAWVMRPVPAAVSTNTSTPPSAAAAMSLSATTMLLCEQLHDATHVRRSVRAPQHGATAKENPHALSAAPTSFDADGSSAESGSGFAALRTAYREARAALLVEARAQLAGLPEAERANFLTMLIRREPSLASDPDLQLELQQASLVPPSEIPELRAWLRAISSEIFPEELPFDTQRTLTRVLGLLEALIQSLAEIHDAQESVRRRWLGRNARRSILQSDKGNLVLAYLLNPQADWNERLSELEQSVRDVVTHELALFRATLEGARALVNTLSPDAIASRVAADGGSALRAEREPGFWTRLLCKDARAIGLWQRFLAMYTELTDGARYERIFLGRVFSRSYLAAMGHPDPVQDSRAATHVT